MKDELLTIQQAADLLGVSTKTLRRWETKGNLIPQRTMGNQRRYSKAELEALFHSQTGKAKVQPAIEVVNEPVIVPEPEIKIVSEQVTPKFEEPIVTSAQKSMPGITGRLIFGAVF